MIALSGDLIPITPGTLILLGISGATTVIAKGKTPRPLEPDAATAAQVARAEHGAMEARGTAEADAQAGEARIRQPRWSDLIMEGQEVDVTRVQMLVFTVVTACFVVMKVMTTHEIPKIPDGSCSSWGSATSSMSARNSYPPTRRLTHRRVASLPAFNGATRQYDVVGRQRVAQGRPPPGNR